MTIRLPKTIQLLALLLLAAVPATSQTFPLSDCPLDAGFLELRGRCDRDDGDLTAEICTAIRVFEHLAHDQRQPAVDILDKELAYPEAAREVVMPWLNLLAKIALDPGGAPECTQAQAQVILALGGADSGSKPEVTVVLGRILGWPELLIQRLEEQRLDPVTARASQTLGQAGRQVLLSVATGKAILDGMHSNPLAGMVCGQSPEPAAAAAPDGDGAKHQVDVALRLAQEQGLDAARDAVAEARGLADGPVHEAKLLARAGVGFLIGEFGEAALDHLRLADELLAEDRLAEDRVEKTVDVQLLHAFTRYCLTMAYRELGYTDLAESTARAAEGMVDGESGELIAAIGGSFLRQDSAAANLLAAKLAAGELDPASLEPIMTILGDVVPGLDLGLFDSSMSPSAAPAVDSSCVDELMDMLAFLNLGYFDDAAGVAEEMIARYPSYNSVYLLTVIAGKQFLARDHDGALRNSRKAVDALETRMGTFRVGETLAAATDQGPYLVFRAAVEMAGQANRVEEAFDFAERGRAWTLRRILGGPRDDSGPSEPSVEETTALAAIREVEKKLRAPLLEQTDRETLEKELAEHRSTFVTQRMARKLDAAGETPLARVKAVTLARLRNEILPQETTLLVYAEGSNDLWAWVIDRETVEMVLLAVPEDQRTAQVKDAVSGMRTRGARPLGNPANESLEALFSQLITPVADYLRYDNLIIVPHGVLHHLPFAALRDPKTGDYLIEKYTLSLAPSATALKQILGSEAAVPAGGEFLVLGDPEVPVTELQPLPGAREEAEAVARLLGTEPLLGDQATKTAVLSRTGDVSLLHLAAHGEYNSSHPTFSWIRLASDDSRHGLVAMHEVWDHWSLPQARLVTLSGCQTALGQLTRGDEVLGLTQAFLVAGSRTVLSTLWSVEDEASKELMVEFYQRLLDGMPAAVALRQAQLEQIRQLRVDSPQERNANPFYWAGYTLIGDPQTRWQVAPEAASEDAPPTAEEAPTPPVVQQASEPRRWPAVLALGLLLTAIVAAGVLAPASFRPRLGVLLSPEADMDEGFVHRIRSAHRIFRSSRIYVAADRLQSREAGALARLRAGHRGAVLIQPVRGNTLWQQDAGGDWRRLPARQARARFGVVYRDEHETIFFELRRR